MSLFENIIKTPIIETEIDKLDYVSTMVWLSFLKNKNIKSIDEFNSFIISYVDFYSNVSKWANITGVYERLYVQFAGELIDFYLINLYRKIAETSSSEKEKNEIAKKVKLVFETQKTTFKGIVNFYKPYSGKYCCSGSYRASSLYASEYKEQYKENLDSYKNALNQNITIDNLKIN